MLGACLLPVAAACVDDLQARECTMSEQCQSGGITGQCVVSSGGSARKWCAFQAPECASGSRWGVFAGDGLAGSCVADAGSGPDAGADARAPGIDGPAGVADAPARVADAPTGVSDAPKGVADAPLADAPPVVGAKLALDQNDFTFVPIAPGASAMQMFTLRNSGDQTSGSVTVTLAGPDAAHFALDASGCNAHTLAGGATCPFTVTFTADVPTPRHAMVTATATPGDTQVLTLSGSSLAPALLSAQPTAVDFGTIIENTTPSKGVTVQNDGQVETAALVTSISGTDASLFKLTSDTCKTRVLAPQSSCALTVQFAPLSPGSRTATLSVGYGSKTLTVGLSGVAEAPGSLVASSASFAPLALPGTTTATVTVMNTGSASVTGLTTSIVTGDTSAFSLSTDNCKGMTLAAQGSCTIVVSFAPSSAGTKSSSLVIGSDSSASASTALEASATATLTVTVALDTTFGQPNGTVTSDPPGINCVANGTTGCVAAFSVDAVVLNANPDIGSTIEGWSGPCASASFACNLSLGVGQATTATFEFVP